MNHAESPFAFSGGDSPRETPDIETASEGYAGRFAGPVGAWFLETQAQSVLEFLRPWLGARVLEAGGGHAQLAVPLAQAGYRVTVTGSEPEAAARLARLMPPGSYGFVACDLHKLPFPDRSFDVVTAFRLLAHVSDWSGLLAELCRVAKNAVVVDYPEKISVNLIAERLFAAKLAVEKNTRPFQCYYGKTLAAEFARLGFAGLAQRPQFFLPMALHRGLGRVGFSRGAEGFCRALGLTRALGSPVIMRASRLD
jgi:SAM-dependent methyltransferase